MDLDELDHAVSARVVDLLVWPLGKEAERMMIWINGAFGAGKTTLTEELHRATIRIADL